MNGDADGDQGDDGEPEQFDPAAAFASWKDKRSRTAALAKLGDSDGAIKTARRRLSTLGITSADNPFVVSKLDEPAIVMARELDEPAKQKNEQRLAAYRNPKTDWRDWKRLIDGG